MAYTPIGGKTLDAINTITYMSFQEFKAAWRVKENRPQLAKSHTAWAAHVNKSYAVYPPTKLADICT